jgi:ABC-type multidrug transport system ATPase subunit
MKSTFHSCINYSALPISSSINTYKLFYQKVFLIEGRKRRAIVNVTTPLLISLASAISIYYLDIYLNTTADYLLTKYYGVTTKSLENNFSWHSFDNILINFIGISLISELLQVLESYLNNKFTFSLTRQAEDTTDEKVYSDQNLVKITQNREGRVYPGIAYSYILVATRSSTNLAQATSLLIQATIACCTLYRLNPYLPLLCIAYGGITQLLGGILLNKIEGLEIEMKNIVDIKQKPLKSQSINDAKALVESDAENLNLEHLNRAKNEERRLADRKLLLEHILKYFTKASLILNTAIKWYVCNTLLYDGVMLAGSKVIIEVCMLKIHKAMGYALKIAPQLANTKSHSDSINKFCDVLNREDESITINESYNGEDLSLENFIVSKGRDFSLKVNHITFERGNRYAVFGDNKSGKSTLFSIIKGIKCKQGSIEGNIIYPSNTLKGDIMFIPQRDYVPHGLTLLEIIYAPKILPEKNAPEYEKITQVVIKYLHEAEEEELIRHLNHVKREDSLEWHASLSTGQIKKLKLISAIMHQPKILLLDETFSNIDEATRNLMQDMLRENLPETIILSSYHRHSSTEELSEFYNGKITINNSTISM